MDVDCNKFYFSHIHATCPTYTPMDTLTTAPTTGKK